MEEARQWAQDREARKLHTATWGQNLRARQLFEGLGFECINEIPDARVNGDSTVEYLLHLED
jgi:hypothetical protein